MPQVLNLPGFKLYQGSEYASSSKYASLYVSGSFVTVKVLATELRMCLPV